MNKLETTKFRVLVGILLVTGFWLLTWINIERPVTLNFDEFHYIPAAKAFLESTPLVNLEHPPFGKVILSWSMQLAGDNPMGWRLMSTIFGALTLAGIYVWSLGLFASTTTALFVGLVTVSNQMLYVQSRIGMLDTFMTAFLIWAFVFFSFWWRTKEKTRLLYLSAIFFGLAVGVKWFAVIPMGVSGLCLLTLFFHKKSIKLSDIVGFSLIFLLIYALTFLPMATHLDRSWSDFIQWQIDIWQQQQRVPGEHPYQSSWWTWPLQIRPIWYAYEAIGESGIFRGVALIGNPVVLWTGLLGVIYCIYLAAIKKCVVAKEIVLVYLVCLLSWAIVPRKLMFFYYYYPASLVLGLILAQTFESFRFQLDKKFNNYRFSFVLLCMLCFMYFLPILGAYLAPANKLMSWAWFSGWI